MLGFLPIDHWNSEVEVSLSPEISIISRRTQDAFDLRWWSPQFLSGDDLYWLGSTQFWICYEGQNPDSELELEHRQVLSALDSAVLATQIMTPSGSPNVRLLCHPGGAHPFCCRRNQLHEAEWARVGQVDQALVSGLPTVLSGVDSVLSGSGPQRLLNPIRLLEHGLQSSERLIRLLVFTAGLDMMLMAVKEKPFVERICALLGAETLIFPPSRRMQDQPKYVVGELAPDIFKIRNQIAHGKIIEKKYLERTGFLTAGGSDAFNLGPGYSHCQHLDVLSQGAAFLLGSALRTVLTNPTLMAEIGSDSKWKARLKGRTS